MKDLSNITKKMSERRIMSQREYRGQRTWVNEVCYICKPRVHLPESETGSSPSVEDDVRQAPGCLRCRHCKKWVCYARCWNWRYRICKPCLDQWRDEHDSLGNRSLMTHELEIARPVQPIGGPAVINPWQTSVDSVMGPTTYERNTCKLTFIEIPVGHVMQLGTILQVKNSITVTNEIKLYFYSEYIKLYTYWVVCGWQADRAEFPIVTMHTAAKCGGYVNNQQPGMMTFIAKAHWFYMESDAIKMTTSFHQQQKWVYCTRARTR